MEYGLRQYEARQRLLWFLFLLFCALIAFPARRIYLAGVDRAPVVASPLMAFKSMAFWHQQYWVRESAAGEWLAYLVWLAVAFGMGRLLWVSLQFVGKFLLGRVLRHVTRGRREPVGKAAGGRGQAAAEAARQRPASLLYLARDLGENPLRFLFHAYRRAMYTVTHAQGVLVAQDLLDRQNRLSEIDWQVLNATWSPYRWLVRALPLLAVCQALWLLYVRLEPFLAGQKDLTELAGALLPTVLPVAQVVVVMVGLTLAYGLASRLEGLYLANLDALFYDRMLSSLPVRSSDTLLILESLEKHCGEIRSGLERLEKLLQGPE